MMTNTTALVWWGYLRFLHHRAVLSIGWHHLRENIYITTRSTSSWQVRVSQVTTKTYSTRHTNVFWLTLQHMDIYSNLSCRHYLMLEFIRCHFMYHFDLIDINMCVAQCTVHIHEYSQTCVACPHFGGINLISSYQWFSVHIVFSAGSNHKLNLR